MLDELDVISVWETAQDPARAEAAVKEPEAQEPQGQQRDRVTLKNGDVLHGKLMDFRDGNLTFNTDDLGDLEIPLSRVVDLSTAEPIVVVMTHQRTHVNGRIRSIVGDQLQIAVDEEHFTTIPLANWDAMRSPDGGDAMWRGSLSLGGRVSTGNTEERRLNFAVNFRRRTDGDRIIGAFSYFYDEDFNDITGDYELDERRGNALLQYDYFLGPETYAWGLAQANTDTEAQVDLRQMFGAGGGYQFAETDRFHLEGLLGVVYYEKTFDTGEPTLAYPAARIGYNLNWEFLSGANLIQSLQVVPSLENFDEDVYLRAETRLRVTFWKSLFTELFWIFEYDTTPAAGRDPADSLIVLNLGWSF
jgi:putative salt-induced outer membrane protein